MSGLGFADYHTAKKVFPLHVSLKMKNRLNANGLLDLNFKTILFKEN